MQQEKVILISCFLIICVLVGSSSGTDADEETVEAGGETEISLEGMDLDDEDDLVEHGRKPAPAPELDLEFEQDLKVNNRVRETTEFDSRHFSKNIRS